MTRTTFVLRETRTSELDRVTAFYERHQDPNVVLHSVAEQHEAAERGLHFVVERGGEILAATLVVPVGTILYVEGGNTVVEPSIRGYRLQDLLVIVRAAAVVVAEGPDVALVIGANPTKNQVSLRNIYRAGLKFWATPHPQFLEHCAGCPERQRGLPACRVCCCDFAILEKKEHRELVTQFLEFGRAARLRNRQGEELIVELASRYATDRHCRQVLVEFALGITRQIS